MKVFTRIVIAVLLGLFVSFVYPIILNANIILNLSWSFLDNRWTAQSFGFISSLGASILIMLALSKGRLSSYGFKLPINVHLIRIVLLSVGLGIVSYLILNLISIEGLKPFPFFRMVVFAWIYAPISEEVYCRGLVQSFLAPLKKYGFSVFRIRISLPVLISALFFGLIHIFRVTMGVNVSSALYSAFDAFIMGIIAAYFREKTESLIPAIIVHMLANIGGSILDFL